MRTYPLIKTKISNERLMSALLLVLLLHNLPRAITRPGSLLTLLLLLVIGLILDAAAHFILYKRPVCAVSAAVTVLIIYTVTPETPFWAECASLFAALIAGKLVWGGTGKNPLNPAMVGLVFLAFISPVRFPVFETSFLLLPAVILSVPFLLIRPYAGLGMIVGMLSALLLNHTMTVEAVLSSGVFFWGCLIITDPVTTTSKPVTGLIIGLLAGYASLASGISAAVIPNIILASNILSYLADWLNIGNNEKLKKTFRRNQKVMLSGETALEDLTGVPEHNTTDGDISALTCDDMLRRIEKNGVFGCGGAAFPSITKLRTVMASPAAAKHLIINAVECDPGLVHDKWLLRNRGNELVKGIDILSKCVSFKSVTVAAKDFLGVSLPAPIQMRVVSDFYPAGAEKILVRSILNTALTDGIPAAEGILVFNIQTVLAIAEAVISNSKAATRFITVADLDTRTGKAVRVKLGSDIHETLEHFIPNAVSVYTGGGMMNARLADDGDVIDEKTNFLAVGQITGFRDAVCSQCNFCGAYCPAALSVRELAQLVDDAKLDKAKRLHPEKCMECGLCSVVCPAGRDQAKRVRTAKNAVVK